MTEIEGKKYDNGKNRMGLVLQGFSNALWEVGRVGTFGANKYGAENWRYLENGIERYKDALFRHLFQYMQGKDLDDESGLKHLSHACWNCLSLLEFELKETQNKGLKGKSEMREDGLHFVYPNGMDFIITSEEFEEYIKEKESEDKDE